MFCNFCFVFKRNFASALNILCLFVILFKSDRCALIFPHLSRQNVLQAFTLCAFPGGGGGRAELCSVS